MRGCGQGFDLGGSDRKCAALIDGKVVFSEEVRWDPYFNDDPSYHYKGIMHSLELAAAHLPRVDAIGGSSAGVYINNKVRVASLFRGVEEKSKELFDSQVKNMFLDVAAEWKVPFEVLNDGDVTALAASMSLEKNAIIGMAMGIPTPLSPLFLGRFSPVFRRFSAVHLRCPASWRRDGENGRKMAENGRNLGEKRARNSGG